MKPYLPGRNSTYPSHLDSSTSNIVEFGFAFRLLLNLLLYQFICYTTIPKKFNMASVPTEWYRDSFLISTAPSLIQPAEINAAFGSESVYWTKPMDETLLKKMLKNSLCFGVYELPSSSSDIAGSNFFPPYF